MKIILVGLLLSFLSSAGLAQQQYADSLKKIILSEKSESFKIAALGRLSSYYSELYTDSGVYYADKMIGLATEKNDDYDKALGFLYKSLAFNKMGDFTSAIQMAYKGLDLSKELNTHRLLLLSKSYKIIGGLNSLTGNPAQALNYLNESISLHDKSGEYDDEFYQTYFDMAFAKLIQDKSDSALIYLNKGFDLYSTSDNKRDITPWIVSGNVYRGLGDLQKAENYFQKGIQLATKNNSLFLVAALSSDLAGLFYEKGKKDSCIHYVYQCLYLSQKYHYKTFEMYASGFLSFLYDSVNTDSNLKYLKITVAAKDEIYNETKIRQFQAAGFDEEKKDTELANAKTMYANRLRLYAVVGAAFVFFVITFILFRNNRQKQKANSLLAMQKQKVESTLQELQSTQSQLIQSEKMASLGELTAGIAHEIQNPLNFVNNFSEVSNELIDELKDERQKAESIRNAALEDELLNDIAQNLEKINHHGKRADAIVKGMLQHSRSGTGVKEPTDINALCDEYLRLAYHGLKAKDNSFNAIIKTDFDENIEKINIIPQDIGRVLLNLYNNAFYAVAERRRTEGAEYEPTVSVVTKLTTSPSVGRGVSISVSDNGNGVPKNIIDKIFQPFFTTKPTGQGTGLGLSLSYDIIKAHGGEIKVNSTENEGSEFIINLPS